MNSSNIKKIFYALILKNEYCLLKIQISDGEVDNSPKKSDEENTKASMSNAALFKIYFRSGASWFLIGFYVLVLVATQVFTSGTDWWLGQWTNIEDARSKKAAGYEQPINFTGKSKVKTQIHMQ